METLNREEELERRGDSRHAALTVILLFLTPVNTAVDYVPGLY